MIIVIIEKKFGGIGGEINMGKRSREKRTGKTYKQRVKKPNGSSQYDIGSQTLKEEKTRRKERVMSRYIAQLFKNGELSGIKRKVET